MEEPDGGPYRKMNWLHEEIKVFLNTWHDNFADLRYLKKKDEVHEKMALELNLQGFKRNSREVQHKIHNMTNSYNTQKRLPYTSWRYFKEVHEIMNSIPYQKKARNESKWRAYGGTTGKHYSKRSKAAAKNKQLEICYSVEQANEDEVSSECEEKPSVGEAYTHLIRVANSENENAVANLEDSSEDSGLQVGTSHAVNDNISPRSPSPDYATSIRRIKSEEEEGTVDEEQGLSVNSIVSSYMLDPEFNFLMSLMPYLKKMPMHKRLKAHIRMQEVIYELANSPSESSVEEV